MEKGMAGRADQTLLNGLAAGKEEAFGQLYDFYGQRLFRAAFGIVGRREDAEDAVQDVFLGLARAGRTLACVENLNAYLFAALHRAAMRRVVARRQEPRVDDLAPAKAPARQEGEAELGARLGRALHSLPLEQREVVALKIDGGLTFEEIAEALSVKVNTAASRYRYALEKLRAALGEASSGVKEPAR
jgi:RNA polymerase sigma-70 factor (ECF subfamily)